MARNAPMRRILVIYKNLQFGWHGRSIRGSIIRGRFKLPARMPVNLESLERVTEQLLECTKVLAPRRVLIDREALSCLVL